MSNNIIIIIFLSFFIFNNHLLAENNIKYPLKYSYTKTKYIKQNCDLGKKYFLKDNKDFFRKILVGKWSALPHSIIIFNEDGKFTLIYKMRYKKEGIWDIGNNCILLKFNDDNNYSCIEIEYYILSNYDETYIFEVLFKNDYYWGGELYLEFK